MYTNTFNIHVKYEIILTNNNNAIVYTRVASSRRQKLDLGARLIRCCRHWREYNRRRCTSDTICRHGNRFAANAVYLRTVFAIAVEIIPKRTDEGLRPDQGGLTRGGSSGPIHFPDWKSPYFSFCIQNLYLILTLIISTWIRFIAGGKKKKMCAYFTPKPKVERKKKKKRNLFTVIF